MSSHHALRLLLTLVILLQSFSAISTPLPSAQAQVPRDFAREIDIQSVPTTNYYRIAVAASNQTYFDGDIIGQFA